MNTIKIIDSKFGRHRVYASDVIRPAGPDVITGELLPEIRYPNLQLAHYALGVLEQWGIFKDYTHVTMIIVQPFLDHVDSYTCTVAELLEVREYLRAKAEETRTNPVFRPSADACRFCLRSGDCEAQTKAVIEMTLDGFTDVDRAVPAPIPPNRLGSLYAALPMISAWCDAVAERTREALLEGRPVVRNDGLAYKLIAGRATARTWKDPALVEQDLAEFLSDTLIYKKTLVTPAQLEPLAKSKQAKKGEAKIPPVISAEQWQSMQQHITQGQAQPSIVLETDSHPAIAPASDGFEEVPDNIDLFI